MITCKHVLVNTSICTCCLHDNNTVIYFSAVHISTFQLNRERLVDDIILSPLISTVKLGICLTCVIRSAEVIAMFILSLSLH